MLVLLSSGFVCAMSFEQVLSFENVKREALWVLEKDIVGLSNYIKGYPEIMPQIKELKTLTRQGSTVYQMGSKPHVEAIQKAFQCYRDKSDNDW